MPEQQLKQQLAQLHQDLSAGAEIDEETRGLLLQLARDIEGAVADKSGTEQTPEPVEEESGLLARLQHLADEFEESHPDISMTIGRVADALSQLGI